MKTLVNPAAYSPEMQKDHQQARKLLKVTSPRNIKNNKDVELSSPLPVRRIKSATSSPLLTNTPNSFTSITAHYTLNKTLHQAFYKLLQKQHLKTALSVGIQFCRVALWDIPQHSYYSSPKYMDLKHESAKYALDVSEILPAIVQNVENELKSNVAYKEKMEETNLLLDVARDHYHSLADAPSGMSSPRRANMVKKEVIDVDDGFSSWLRVLECGDNRLSLNICPPSLQQLSSISEKEVADEIRESNDKISSPQDKLRHHYNPIPSATDFSRSTSAPGILGQSKLPPQRRRNVEVREPAPTIVENVPPGRSNQNGIVKDMSKDELQYESDLERALYLSGLEFQPASQETKLNSNARFPGLKQVEDDIIEIATLAQLYRDDFEDMRRNQIISVTYLDTYQGRVRDSMNGCTVIAPLLAIHHLCSEDKLRDRNKVLLQGRNTESQRQSDPYQTSTSKGIQNETIRAVIDVQAAMVAPLVRDRLGLPKDALIIPSDVHDYFIDENYLSSSQFAGVFGGNMLDENHLQNFIEFIHRFGRSKGADIDTGEPVRSRKIAATFFFHEHVVSLHRVTKNVVTSFRNHTYQPPVVAKKGIFNRLRRWKNKSTTAAAIERYNDDVTTISEEETWYEIIDSLPGVDMFNSEEGREQSGDECYSHLPSTARIRCNSPKSLHACLRWYACSKFTIEDQKFIDSYMWNDLNVEFDPRVFQAFVWSD
eukprot:scaffold6294_cov268-Chaetoceros_neogracile.AAC.3